MFSKSVCRYFKVLFNSCFKVSFYPPNINIVLFYWKYTDIDIDAQYQEIYTDILVLSVFFSIIMKPFKNTFFALFIFQKGPHHACLLLLLIYIGKVWHAMLACLLLLIIIITYKNAISCSSHDSTSSRCQTWSLTIFLQF